MTISATAAATATATTATAASANATTAIAAVTTTAVSTPVITTCPLEEDYQGNYKDPLTKLLGMFLPGKPPAEQDPFADMDWAAPKVKGSIMTTISHLFKGRNPGMGLKTEYQVEHMIFDFLGVLFVP